MNTLLKRAPDVMTTLVMKACTIACTILLFKTARRKFRISFFAAEQREFPYHCYLILSFRDHFEDRKTYDPLEVEREQKVIVGLLLEVNLTSKYDHNVFNEHCSSSNVKYMSIG